MVACADPRAPVPDQAPKTVLDDDVLKSDRPAAASTPTAPTAGMDILPSESEATADASAVDVHDSGAWSNMKVDESPKPAKPAGEGDTKLWQEFKDKEALARQRTLEKEAEDARLRKEREEREQKVKAEIEAKARAEKDLQEKAEAERRAAEEDEQKKMAERRAAKIAELETEADDLGIENDLGLDDFE